MAFTDHIVFALNVACAIIFVLAIILLILGIMWRKSAPAMFKLGIASMALAAAVTFLVKLTVGFYAFSEALQQRFNRAIETQTTVDYSGVIHPTVFAASAYWWQLAFIILGILVGSFFLRKLSSPVGK